MKKTQNIKRFEDLLTMTTLDERADAVVEMVPKDAAQSPQRGYNIRFSGNSFQTDPFDWIAMNTFLVNFEAASGPDGSGPCYAKEFESHFKNKRWQHLFSSAKSRADHEWLILNQITCN